MTFVAKFRVEVDWGDDSYAHARSDVTDLYQALRLKYGNDIAVGSAEAPVQFGEGRLQLRAGDGVFGEGGAVTLDQLKKVHLFRITERTTNLQQFEGQLEFEEEWYARFLAGDILNFHLRGKAWLKGGGVLTYPKGSEYGGPLSAGQEVVVDEAFWSNSHGNVILSLTGGTLPSQLTLLSDGRAAGIVSGAIRVVEGERILEGDTFGVGSDVTLPGRSTQLWVTDITLTTSATNLTTLVTTTTTATVSGYLPATVDRERVVTTYSTTPMFEHDGVLWRLKRVRRTYSGTIPAYHQAELLNFPDLTITQIRNRPVSAAPSSANRSSTDIWTFEGRRIITGDGPLRLQASPVQGGEVPVALRSGYFFTSQGTLYQVASGSLYRVDGFPESPTRTLIAGMPAPWTAPLWIGEIDGSVNIIRTGHLSRVDSLSAPVTVPGGGLILDDLVGMSFDSLYQYVYRSDGSARRRDRFIRTAFQPTPMNPSTARLADTLAVEYFDESEMGEDPRDFLRAYAAALGVTYAEGKSTALPSTIGGLVRYGPQWDISLVDTAYRGWTGQFLLALRNGNFAAVWPNDLDATTGLLTFDEYLVMHPFELRLNRKAVVNSIHAEGYEVH